MVFNLCLHPGLVKSQDPLIKDLASWLHPRARTIPRSNAPSLASVFYWGPFYEAQIVWGFGDHRHNCRHHENVCVSSILQGLRQFLGGSKLRFVPPDLADLIQKGRKRILFIQNVSRWNIYRQRNHLFILHLEIVPLKKKFGIAELI